MTNLKYLSGLLDWESLDWTIGLDYWPEPSYAMALHGYILASIDRAKLRDYYTLDVRSKNQYTLVFLSVLCQSTHSLISLAGTAQPNLC